MDTLNPNNMINLQEELLKIPPRKTTEEINQELLLKEATSILQANNNKDIAILEDSGLFKSQKEQVKTITEEMAKYSERVKNLEENRIFTITQIKQLCVKYRLRFLPTSYYKGTIDPQLPQKIKEFNQKTTGKFTYYIVAPASSFNLEKRPVDPLMFASLGQGRYYLIHKWGNDLSGWRRILGFLTSKKTAFRTVTTILSGGFIAEAVYQDGIIVLATIMFTFIAVVIVLLGTITYEILTETTFGFSEDEYDSHYL